MMKVAKWTVHEREGKRHSSREKTAGIHGKRLKSWDRQLNNKISS
jgi:hypothetical protein